MFNKAFGHETRYLAAEADGEIVGILPLVIFKSQLSAPVQRVAAVCELRRHRGRQSGGRARARRRGDCRDARTRAESTSSCAIRGGVFPSFPAKQHKVAMILPLAESEERQWAALDRKIRNQVRKAEKSQLRTTAGRRRARRAVL